MIGRHEHQDASVCRACSLKGAIECFTSPDALRATASEFAAKVAKVRRLARFEDRPRLSDNQGYFQEHRSVVGHSDSLTDFRKRCGQVILQRSIFKLRDMK